MTTSAPGLPDMKHVVGDWTGEVAAKQEREALAYREARERLRAMYVQLSRRRELWAESKEAHAAARAVAYQSVMADVGRIIADIEKVAGA